MAPKYFHWVFLFVVLIGIEVALRTMGPRLFGGYPPAGEYVLAERLTYSRDPKVADRPIAQYDPEIGWVSDRLPALKPSKRPIVAVFGASWTYGLDVDEKEAYPVVLNELTSDLDGRNYGVAGYGLDQMLLLANRIVPKLNPQWIVIGFVASDLHSSCFPFYYAKRKPRWSSFEAASPEPSWVRTPAEVGEIHRRPLEKTADFLVSQLFHSKIAMLILSAAVQPVINQCVVEFNANLMDRAQRRWGDRLILAHLGRDLPKAFVSEMAQRNIPIVSIKDGIDQQIAVAGPFIIEGQHPNPSYQRAMAELLVQAIRERGAC